MSYSLQQGLQLSNVVAFILLQYAMMRHSNFSVLYYSRRNMVDRMDMVGMPGAPMPEMAMASMAGGALPPQPPAVTVRSKFPESWIWLDETAK